MKRYLSAKGQSTLPPDLIWDLRLYRDVILIYVTACIEILKVLVIHSGSVDWRSKFGFTIDTSAYIYEQGSFFIMVACNTIIRALFARMDRIVRLTFKPFASIGLLINPYQYQFVRALISHLCPLSCSLAKKLWSGVHVVPKEMRLLMRHQTVLCVSCRL